MSSYLQWINARISKAKRLMKQFKVRWIAIFFRYILPPNSLSFPVAFRLRPLNNNERNHKSVWKVLPNYSAITQTNDDGTALAEKAFGKTLFAFDKTFDETSTTQQVYDSVAKGIVSSVSAGVNGTIFAYGQTSSGKTYTMQGSGTIEEGTSGSGGGIVHMAAKDVFNHIHSHPDRSFLVRASFLEIYNEEVRDLLVPSNENRTVSIREDPRRGVFVQSKEAIVGDYHSLLSVLFQGEKSRAFAATAMNERSSRSHTIFRITIESRAKARGDKENDFEDEEESSQADDADATLVSTLNLVDLAGSESVRHTGATGDRQKEGGMINTRYVVCPCSLTYTQMLTHLVPAVCLHFLES
jgi:centromeric protein E